MIDYEYEHSLSLMPRVYLCRFQIRYEPLNLNKLQYLIDSGRIDPSKPINMNTLYWSGAVGKIEDGVKLLADVSLVSE